MEDNQDKHVSKYAVKNFFVCEVCKKGFSQKYHLKRHHQTHKIEKENIYLITMQQSIFNGR